MGHNMRLLLEMAEETKRLTMEGLEFNAAQRKVKEMYKKNHLHCDQTDEGDNVKILNDILTDKVDLDNYGVYGKDGQTIKDLI